MASQVALVVKNPPANAGDVRDTTPTWSLEEGMATHSSILAWRIQCTEEPDGLVSPQGGKESDMTEQLTIPHGHILYLTKAFLAVLQEFHNLAPWAQTTINFLTTYLQLCILMVLEKHVFSVMVTVKILKTSTSTGPRI